MQQSHSELLNETIKLHNEFNEINLGKIQLNTKVELTKYYQDQLRTLNILSWIILLTGLLFITVGFYFWYIKIQKPNDLILIKQAEESPQTGSSE